MNTDGFIALCQPNHKDLYKWLSDEMGEYYGADKIVSKDGYIVCEGNFPIMLCSHLDTVHKEQITDAIINITGSISAYEGIGGDDRCGVYAVLSILKSLGEDKKPWLFFSTDEETGGKATKKCAKDMKERVSPVKFLIAFDRKGKNDSVYYSCGNKEFQDFIDSHGFKKETGSYTDICALSSEWGVASVNLSVGYYNAHTVSEYVVPKELDDTIEKSIKIIKDYDGTKDYPYSPAVTPTYTTLTHMNKYRSYFFAGDSVYARKYAKGSTKPSGKKDKEIKEGKIGYVITASAYDVQVNFGDQTLWVDETDIELRTYK